MQQIQNSLYRIKTSLLYLLAKVEEADGELTPELEEALRINEQQLQESADSYVGIIARCEDQSDAIDNEIKRLKVLKEKTNKLEDLFRKQLADAMNLFQIDRIDTAFSKISFRRADSVQVYDEKLVSPEYWEVPPPVISKTKIKEAIKAGKIVNGAIIETKKHLQIK